MSVKLEVHGRTGLALVAGNLSFAESWFTENQISFWPTRAGKSIRFSNVAHANPFELKIQLFLDHPKWRWQAQIVATFCFKYGSFPRKRDRSALTRL